MLFFKFSPELTHRRMQACTEYAAIIGGAFFAAGLFLRLHSDDLDYGSRKFKFVVSWIMMIKGICDMVGAEQLFKLLDENSRDFASSQRNLFPPVDVDSQILPADTIINMPEQEEDADRIIEEPAPRPI